MKYIFTDIDGTLCYRDNCGKQALPANTLKTLKMLKENGHLIFLTTGRSLFSAKDVIKDFKFDGYVCSLGSYVTCGEEVLIDNPFDETEIEDICQKARKYHILMMYECLNLIFVDEEWQKTLRNYRDQSDFEHWRNLESYTSKIPVYKVTIKASNKEDFLNFESEINKSYNVVHGVKEDVFFAEITKGSNSKGLAIKKLIRDQGYKYEDIITIGDSPNDLDMMIVGYTSIAMGNSFKIIKEHATMVTDDVCKDGFYLAFKKLGLVE